MMGQRWVGNVVLRVETTLAIVLLELVTVMERVATSTIWRNNTRESLQWLDRCPVAFTIVTQPS